jgi:hypothetical protein
MNDPNLPDYEISLRIEDIRLLHHSVQETIKFWPGAPARPYEEQEHLWHLRDSLYRIILDYRFNKL